MFTVNELLKATKGRLIGGRPSTPVSGISIDSRTIRANEAFVALKGKNFDGHSYIKEAVSKGASGVIVHRMNAGSGTRPHFVISVPDSIAALGDVARYHRDRFDIPIVAVTGSNGKSTTKEMIAEALGRSCLKNRGTQNNHIGVPLTLLKIRPRHKSAVMELGMNRPGEIRKLSGMVRPNIGVVTNIGLSHLAGLKTMEGVYRAKKELLDALGRWDIAVLNNDDRYLRRYRRKGLKIVTYGIKSGSDYRATSIKREAKGWSFKVNGRSYLLPLLAYHDIYNALAAITTFSLFNRDHKDIAAAIKGFQPLRGRMTSKVLNGVRIIDDSYNSSPLSLESAVRTLAKIRTGGKKILICGDMLELGASSRDYHREAGKAVARSGIYGFIGVGELAGHSVEAARRSGMTRSWSCASQKEAARILSSMAGKSDVVLVKGSRATKMEEVIRCFTTSSIR